MFKETRKFISFLKPFATYMGNKNASCCKNKKGNFSVLAQSCLISFFPRKIYVYVYICIYIYKFYIFNY